MMADDSFHLFVFSDLCKHRLFSSLSCLRATMAALWRDVKCFLSVCTRGLSDVTIRATDEEGGLSPAPPAPPQWQVLLPGVCISCATHSSDAQNTRRLTGLLTWHQCSDSWHSARQSASAARNDSAVATPVKPSTFIILMYEHSNEAQVLERQVQDAPRQHDSLVNV